jgi:hypothetical protein
MVNTRRILPLENEHYIFFYLALSNCQTLHTNMVKLFGNISQMYPNTSASAEKGELTVAHKSSQSEYRTAPEQKTITFHPSTADDTDHSMHTDMVLLRVQLREHQHIRITDY